MKLKRFVIEQLKKSYSLLNCSTIEEYKNLLTEALKNSTSTYTYSYPLYFINSDDSAIDINYKDILSEVEASIKYKYIYSDLRVSLDFEYNIQSGNFYKAMNILKDNNSRMLFNVSNYLTMTNLTDEYSFVCVLLYIITVLKNETSTLNKKRSIPIYVLRGFFKRLENLDITNIDPDIKKLYTSNIKEIEILFQAMNKRSFGVYDRAFVYPYTLETAINKESYIYELPYWGKIYNIGNIGSHVSYETAIKEAIINYINSNFTGKRNSAKLKKILCSIKNMVPLVDIVDKLPEHVQSKILELEIDF